MWTVFPMWSIYFLCGLCRLLSAQTVLSMQMVLSVRSLHTFFRFVWSTQMVLFVWSMHTVLSVVCASSGSLTPGPHSAGHRVSVADNLQPSHQFTWIARKCQKEGSRVAPQKSRGSALGAGTPDPHMPSTPLERSGQSGESDEDAAVHWTWEAWTV